MEDGVVSHADHPALSWRDVYKAVYESEERIISAVRDSVRPLQNSADDHEARLRGLERSGCATGQEALRVGHALGVKVDALTLSLSANTSSRQGMFETLSNGQKIIITIGAIIGMTAVMLDIFSKYFGGP